MGTVLYYKASYNRNILYPLKRHIKEHDFFFVNFFVIILCSMLTFFMLIVRPLIIPNCLRTSPVFFFSQYTKIYIWQYMFIADIRTRTVIFKMVWTDSTHHFKTYSIIFFSKFMLNDTYNMDNIIKKLEQHRIDSAKKECLLIVWLI